MRGSRHALTLVAVLAGGGIVACSASTATALDAGADARGPSSGSQASATPDAGPSGDAGQVTPASDAGQTSSGLGQVTATVKYAGAKRGSLAVGLFRENPPKTKPPVAFDTKREPAFPFVAQLRDVEPGRYWAIAVLDLPPSNPASVRPAPEDIQAISEPIDLAAGEVRTIDVELRDP